MGLVTTKFPMSNTSLGIEGTMNFLVAYTAAMAGAPKINAVLILPSPCLYLGTAPTSEVVPTINKE